MTTSARAGSHEGPDSPQPWARTSAPPACGKTALPGLFLAPDPGPPGGPQPRPTKGAPRQSGYAFFGPPLGAAWRPRIRGQKQGRLRKHWGMHTGASTACFPVESTRTRPAIFHDV